MLIYRIGSFSQAKSIERYGFSRQFCSECDGRRDGHGKLIPHSGQWYGDGCYCKFTEGGARHGIPKYGDTIYQAKLEGGLNRFLIFDEEKARAQYGEHHSFKDQIYKLFPKDVADQIMSHAEYVMKVAGDMAKPEHHMFGQTSILPQYMFHIERASNRREWYEYLFSKYNIRGIVYTGGNDGHCVAVYKFDDVVPIGYKDCRNGWHEGAFTPMKAEMRQVDAVHKFLGIYKKVDEPVIVENDGELYYFSRVLKKNGKYNIIECNAGEEISDVDFDDVGKMNFKTAQFQFKYNGQMYNAYPNGYLDDDEEFHPFTDLLSADNQVDSEEDDDFYEEPEEEMNDEMDDEMMNEQMEKQFNKILDETFQRCLRSFENGTSILSENAVDETSYWNYEMPTEDELDNGNMVSIYKAISADYLKGNLDPFKIAFDRRLSGGNGEAMGKGIYTTISPEMARQLQRSYGGTILEFKVIGGFDRYVVLDNASNMCVKLYGANLSVRDQLRTFLSDADADYVVSQTSNCRNGTALSNISGRFKIRGIIYFYGNLTAALPFDFTSCVPYAISSDGYHFVKRFDEQTLDRMLTNVDVKWMYGDKYKEVEEPIAWYNEEGERTGYSRVKKYDDSCNIIDVQTGEEVLPPYKFSSITPIKPNMPPDRLPNFTVGYNGNLYHADFSGFCVTDEYDEDEIHPWEELDNADELEKEYNSFDFGDDEENSEDDFI